MITTMTKKLGKPGLCLLRW